MKILLTNDDGLECKGIQVLAETLAERHEVWVIAPDRNRSAVSHALTMKEPLRVQKKGERIYTCSGVPADCTLNGLRSNILGDSQPDVVISGINEGANLGTDVLYSGTAAAARQAVLLGVPGIAVSLYSESCSWNYSPLATFIKDNVEQLISLCAHDVFLNINAPSCNKLAGYKFTTLCRREYCDTLELYNAPDGHSYSFFVSGDVQSQGAADSDFSAVEDGFVSLTRIYVEPFAADCSEYREMKLRV